MSELRRLARENHYLKKELRANKKIIINLKSVLERVTLLIQQLSDQLTRQHEKL